jgi:hypothetical protein
LIIVIAVVIIIKAIVVVVVEKHFDLVLLVFDFFINFFKEEVLNQTMFLILFFLIHSKDLTL